MKCTIFKFLNKATDTPYILELDRVVERIRGGKSKALVEEIRAQGDKEKRNELKRRLPCILFAGEFSQRNDSSCVRHSGLMVLDIENVDVPEERKRLEAHPSTVLVFLSPSGQNGLKAVVRVPDTLDRNTHPMMFEAVRKLKAFKNADGGQGNISRVCFESYDPHIYYNPRAEVLSIPFEDSGKEFSQETPTIPVKDSNAIINRIMGWNWQRQYSNGQRNHYIFNLASAFCEFGVDKAEAEEYISNHIATDDLPRRELATTIASAYRSRQFASKYFEDYDKIRRVRKDLDKEDIEIVQKHGITKDELEAVRESDSMRFWYIKNKEVKIDPLKYKLFLEESGFRKYYPSQNQKPFFVRVRSNIVEEIAIEQIKDYILDYLMQLGEYKVWKVCANYATLFSYTFLTLLENVELLMLRDSKTSSYICFKNGIAHIEKDEVTLIDYLDVDGYVWKSNIVEREFKEMGETDNDYSRFIANISGGNPTPFECVIGYLISTYKDKSNNKAIILNDEVISDNPEGGTGKGLFMQGIAQIRKVSMLDGKLFDDKKSFPYQTVSKDTNVLFFDDVKRNFNFESKFSLITEGIELERKNKDAIRLTVEESPKVAVSTNYAIQGEGNSHERRRHELELKQYYNHSKTPADEFGRELFSGWDAKEFLKFDNYMISCVQLYMKLGLVEQEAVNLKLRRLIAETSMDFYEWVSEKGNLPTMERLNKKQYYSSFLDEYTDYGWLKSKRFTQWIKRWCKFNGWEYQDGNSNGERWFEIIAGERVESVETIPF